MRHSASAGAICSERRACCARDPSGEAITSSLSGVWSRVSARLSCRVPHLPTTRCRTLSFAPRSICASPLAPSRSSIAPSASPPSAPLWRLRATAPIPIICRAPIGAMPSGHRIAFGAGPHSIATRQGRSGHRNPRQSSASRTGLSNMSGCIELFRTSTPRDRAEAVSARAIEIGGLNCKSIASLIANHKAAPIPPNQPPLSITPICVALITFIEETNQC